jgi:hypothetical protein
MKLSSVILEHVIRRERENLESLEVNSVIKALVHINEVNMFGKNINKLIIT